MNSLRRAAAGITLGLIALACERGKSPARHDTSGVVLPIPTPRDSAIAGIATPRAPSRWDSTAGSFLIVRESSPAPDSAALVIFPQIDDSTSADSVHFDLTHVRGLPLDLFSRHGAVGSARIAAANTESWEDAECTQWPLAALHRVKAADGYAGWTVAFAQGRADPLPLDSIAAMAPGDSARLAAEVARLASALPFDTSPSFRGVPFLVRDTYRFTAGPGVQAVIAIVVRKLNQEASPGEQHLLLVAERDSTDTNSRYETVYFDRQSGTEETIEVTDVLAGVRIGTPRHVAFILLREGYESGAYALLERSSTRSWGVRWMSAHTGC